MATKLPMETRLDNVTQITIENGYGGDLRATVRFWDRGKNRKIEFRGLTQWDLVCIAKQVKKVLRERLDTTNRIIAAVEEKV